MHHSVRGVYSTLVLLSRELETLESAHAAILKVRHSEHRRQLDFGTPFCLEEEVSGVGLSCVSAVGTEFLCRQPSGMPGISNEDADFESIIGCRTETSMINLEKSNYGQTR